MNKRIAKKRARNFFTTVETSKGPTLVHVNRRGCKNRWTEKDQEMLAKIAEAAFQYHVTARAPAPEKAEL